MFDKYIICENGFENVKDTAGITGFQFKARLPYYRGLGISMIENLSVSVDAVNYAREAMRVSLHGNTYTMDEMETEYADRWEFGEEGVITLLKPGGLTPGLHKIEMTATLRISYLPFLSIGSDAKVLAVA